MSITLKLRDFSDINLHSNENLNKVIKKLVNESANAVHVATFEDQVILFDTVNEEFYFADYKVTKDKISIGKFQQVEINEEANDFNESIKDYFSGNKDLEEVNEDYEKNFITTSTDILLESVNESIGEKSGKYSIFNDILKAKDKTDLKKFNETKMARDYKKIYESKPPANFYYFDFKSTTSCSLYEEEDGSFFIGNKTKAKDLWNDAKFRNSVLESIKTNKFYKIVESYPVISLLNKTERKALLSKSLLMENVTDASVKIKLILEDEATNSSIEDTKASTPETKEDGTTDKVAPTDGDIDTAVATLTDLESNLTVDTAKTFITSLKDKLEAMKSGNYDENVIKEITKLLEIPKEEPVSTETPTPAPVDANKGI